MGARVSHQFNESILDLKQPIVVVSSWGGSVSFSGVLRHVLSALGKRPIYIMALDQRGEVRVEGGVTIIPTFCDGYETRRAVLVLEAVCRIKPAAVLFFYDLFAAQYHYPILVEIQRRLAPVVIYLPIDGTLVNAQPLQAAANFERLVFYTEAAQRRFLKLCDSLDMPEQNTALEQRCRVIAHGVDRASFFPTEGGKLIAKQMAFPNQPQLHQAPIILNANQPWERKRLDLTVEGFSRFLAKSDREVYLYLHLPGARSEDIEALEQQTQALGIQQYVVLGGTGRRSIEDLNWLYNACEVGINTAMGEGWGLVSCEHAATGAAQIVTDDEQLREIWGSAALYAKITSTEQNWFCPHVEYQVVDPISAGQSLHALFSDQKLLQKHSTAATARMEKSRFDWEYIEQQWATLFDEVLEYDFPRT